MIKKKTFPKAMKKNCLFYNHNGRIEKRDINCRILFKFYPGTPFLIYLSS